MTTALRARLTAATSLAAEVDALLADFPPRDAALVRARWGLEAWGPPPRLEDVGRRHGVGKERVRQLVRTAEMELAEQAPPLGVAARVAARLAAAWDALSRHDATALAAWARAEPLVGVAAAAGSTGDAGAAGAIDPSAVLRALGPLAALGLLAPEPRLGAAALTAIQAALHATPPIELDRGIWLREQRARRAPMRDQPDDAG